MENSNFEKTHSELPEVFRDIKNSDLAEVDKLAKAFEWMIDRVLEHSKRDIELARAMKDQETLIREQIKHAVMKSAKGIFQDCFRAVLGRKAWDA
jgi:hypothetical protein